MSMTRQWIAECDHEGCAVTFIVGRHPEKNDAGRALNDEGWQAAPATKMTLCPEHVMADTDWRIAAGIPEPGVAVIDAMLRGLI